MSIEAQPHHEMQETGTPVDYSLVERLSPEERAVLQIVRDTPPNKSLLYPPEAHELMKTLPTNDEGERTRAGEVIAIRKYAEDKLSKDTAPPSRDETSREATAQHQSVATSRRATHKAGTSPYATGDGMITPKKATKIELGGSIKTGTGQEGVSRRAIRGAKKLPKVDVNNYEPRGTSHRRDDIGDLVTLDKTGRARYKSGVGASGRNLKGRFITKHELDTIAANQEQIRDGLDGRNEANTMSTDQQADTIRQEASKAAYVPTTTLGEIYGDITDFAQRPKDQQERIIKAAQMLAGEEGKRLLVMPEKYGDAADFYGRSEELQKRIINVSAMIAAEDRAKQLTDKKSRLGTSESPAWLWSAEQDAAIESLKRPIAPAKHNMNTRRGRLAYAVENRTTVSEVAAAIGRPAVEALVRLDNARLEFEQNMKPKLAEATKAMGRYSRLALRRGVELDTRMIYEGMKMDLKIGELLIAGARKLELDEKAKKSASKFDEWLNAK